MTADTKADANARAATLLCPTAMRLAFEQAAPNRVGRSKVGIARRPAWTVTRTWRTR